jgi:hypothetical protein
MALNTPIPHASLLSMITQSVISTAVAYPIMFEYSFDLA